MFAVRPFPTVGRAFLISRPSLKPREFVKDVSLLLVVLPALGGRFVLSSRLLLLVPSDPFSCDELAT